MAIKTKIAGISVEVELVCVQLDNGQTANTVKVLSIGDGKTIYTPQDIENIHIALEEVKKNPWPVINDILNNIQNTTTTTTITEASTTTTTTLAEVTTTTTTPVVTDDNNIIAVVQKNWYMSKTIWVNLIGLIFSTLTIFGLKKTLTPEQVSTIAQLLAVVLTIVNIYLRKGNNIPISDIQMPLLKMFKK